MANFAGLAHADTETSATSPGPKFHKADARPHKLSPRVTATSENAGGATATAPVADTADADAADAGGEGTGDPGDPDVAAETTDEEGVDAGVESGSEEVAQPEVDSVPSVSGSGLEDDAEEPAAAPSEDRGGNSAEKEPSPSPHADTSQEEAAGGTDVDAMPGAGGADGDAEQPSQEPVARPLRANFTRNKDHVSAAAVSAPPVEQEVVAVQVMTALVSGAISPLLDPHAPATAPWFDGLLAWVRRQIQHTFFNESPVYGPIESHQIVTGQVLVDLHAYDPNGDPLTYTIVQPAHGRVTRDPLTGQFIYTPTSVVTGNPVQDSFKVVISDGSEDLRGPFKLMRLVFHTLARAIGIAERDDVTVTVPVTVNPIVSVPPVVVTTGAGTYVVGANPVKLLSGAIITDADSTKLMSATVSLTNGRSGDLLTYTAPPGNPVTAQWNATTKILTLSGAATLAQYEAALQAISFSTTQGGAPRIASITVKDDSGLQSLVGGVASVIVVATPPLLVVTPVAVGTSGTGIRVSPVVSITDLDSQKLSSATVTVQNAAAGDVLGYGTLPTGVTATVTGGSVTFVGAATVAAYQQLLQSVTLTSADAGIKTVTFAVTDDQSESSVPVSTVVTVVGLPVNAPPLVVVAPVAAGTAGSAVTVSPVVSITDVDSTQLGSATVTASSGTIGYGTLPSGVVATPGAGSVTFTGAASVAAYQDVLQSITLTSNSAAIVTVTFTVVDDQGKASVPATSVVTVVGLPVAAPPLVVVAPVAGGTAGSPVTVSPIVSITDIDSTQFASATVTASGGTIGYGTLPSGVTATQGAGSVTFTGAASVAAYQDLLQSITLTASSAGIVSVSFTVIDDQGKASVPATSVVTVLGVPVAAPPLVVVAPVAAGTAGSAVTVSPVVVITDVDSTQLGSATVTASGGTIGYGTLPGGVTATPGINSVTFTGAASVAAYQQLLQSITLTSGTGIVTVSFTVIDDQGKASVPATSVVTVLGLPVAAPPLVVVAPVAAGTAGSAVTVSPVVVITDVDSTQLASATVTASGGTIGYGTLPGGVTATPGTNSVTFAGAASVAAYQQLLQSITLTSSTGIVTVSFTVIDDQGEASAPASSVVTVLGVPVAAPPLVVVAPVAGGTAGSAVTVSPIVSITDIDSSQLASATVTASGGTIGYGTLPGGVTATPGTNSVTFTGAASVAAYQQLLQSITLTSSTGIVTVSFTVIDDQGEASAPASSVVTVLGVPVAAPPLVVVAPVAAGTAGSAVTVSPIVSISDLDSTHLTSATVKVAGSAGAALGYGTLPPGVVAAEGSNSVTFTGAASVDEYQQLLQSVTVSSSSAGLSAVSFEVTDDQGNTSALATTIVTLLGLALAAAPLVVTAPTAAGVKGSAITVSPTVVISDIDSTSVTAATVSASAGSLAYGALPVGVTATSGAGSVTFTGAASVDAYVQLLQSITLTSSDAGLLTVSFSVTDDQGQTSVPATTVVTVLSAPVAVAPLLVTVPTAAGTVGNATTVSPVVVITDIDSAQLGSATVTTTGGTLSYGTLPEGVGAITGAGSVTFTGAASVDAYEQLLQSITLTSGSTGIVAVTFTVVDDQGKSSVPATTAVTVLGVAVAVAPVLVTAPIASGTAGTAVTVSPAVVITDIDSAQLASATVTTSGGTIGYGALPSGVTATQGANSVTFTGAASVAAYQQLLQSITLTSGAAGIVTVSFTVVDGQVKSSVPATTAVTVLGVPVAVAPVVVAAPIASGTSGTAVTVSPVVVITDVDSTQLASATVTVSDGTLSYGTLPSGVTATQGANSVTFTGAASVAAYQELLQSITLTASSIGIVSVSFTVVDDQGKPSVPTTTAVTVLGVPVAIAPVVVTAPTAAGTTGSPVSVSPVVVITDIDSTQLGSATVTTSGGTLNYGTLPSGVTATPGANSVTFTGAASVAAYQELLQSITLTAGSAGIVTVTLTVVDDQGKSSVPATTAVTVLGVPVAIAPVVVTAPIASGTSGTAVTVSPVVVITDVDSTQLASATVTVSDGTFNYGTLPSGVTATPGANSVTFTGAASVAAYQELLQSITLTSGSAGIVTVTFTVVDDQGKSSVPATTAVTVLGVPVAVAPVVVAAPIASGTSGTAITVSPVVVITDVDSTQLASATVTTSGGTLNYGTLPSGVTATPGTNSVTFTGAASLAAYQELLQSITLTSGSAGIVTVTFTVVDDQGKSSVPATTAVTVLGVPVAVAPVVVAAPIASGTSGTAVTVSPVVVITDVDSTQLASATVTVSDGTLSYGTLPSGVTATPGTNSVTFTGAASVAAYQALLQSITLTSGSAGIVSVTFTVVDDQGKPSVPTTTAVTVLGVPVAIAPVVVTAPTAAGTTGSAVTVSPAVVITDIDSTQLASATVSATGGTLNYGTLPSGVTATPGTNSVTFTGAASVAAYQELLQSITLTASSTGIVTVSFTVVDDQGKSSVPATTAVTVLGVPVAIAPVVVTAPTAAGTTGGVVTVSPAIVITDVDSTQLASATVSATGGTLNYGTLPSGVTATPGTNSVTFTGAASLAAYQELLQSITLTAGSAGIVTVTFTVTDNQGKSSVPATTAVTVVAVPVAAAPALVTSVVSVSYTAGGSAVSVDPNVIVLDADSTTMSGAVVSIVGGAAAGETLGFAAPAGITGNYSGGVLTFTGTASLAAYQQALRSVTYASSSSAPASIASISFVITDSTGKVSAPALVAVTVVAAPVNVAPLVVTSVTNVSYNAGSAGITVDPGVTVLDVDSADLSGAIVKITGALAAGDVLTFVPTGNINGNYNNATGTLTLTGTGTIAQYQQVLRSVTLATAASAPAAIKTVTFTVSDSQGAASASSAVAITVLAPPVDIPPLLVTSVTNVSYTAGNAGATVDSGMAILDLDSSAMGSATVKITGNFSTGDILTFTPQSGIVGSYNNATGTLTFTGTAPLADYQQLLRSVKLSTSSSALAAIKTVTFTVIDNQGSASLPAPVTVTVLAAPINIAPLVATLPGPTYTAGNTAVQVNPLVTVTDLDSANMASATVTITGFAAGDTLGFTTVGNIVGTYSNGILQLSGTATAAQYQQVLQSITFSSSGSASAAIKTVAYTVTDAQGATSPTATTTVTVLANTAPLLTAPLGGTVVLGQQLVSPTAVIVDDSSFLQSATITITNFQSVDRLSYTSSAGITGTYNVSTGVLALTGTASVSDYQAVLQSVKFSKTGLNLVSTRTITMTVRDQQGLDSNTVAGVMTLLL
ncbi:Ig-like domain-containing protein [Mycobacterium kyogaense]|uniref:Ig-like domain-containing protein n=1 Tax=Mycobacterium kyogaense TaxID=2212479 RepID=UPI0013C4324B|nr:Ig-like domain-containing protein [Mycobacterium kyogaense]